MANAGEREAKKDVYGKKQLRLRLSNDDLFLSRCFQRADACAAYKIVVLAALLRTHVIAQPRYEHILWPNQPNTEQQNKSRGKKEQHQLTLRTTSIDSFLFNKQINKNFV